MKTENQKLATAIILVWYLFITIPMYTLCAILFDNLVYLIVSCVIVSTIDLLFDKSINHYIS